MKSRSIFAATILLSASITVSAVAAEPFKKEIGARQAVMRLYSFNLGQLGAMAKGKMAYDAGAATAAANNLLSLATLKGGPMWAKGSGADNPALAGETRAKAEIWTTYPKVAEKGQALAKAAQAMAAAAGNGLDAVRANIGAVGGSCKGCHESFRAPKQK